MARTRLLAELASVALTLGGAALAADIPEACDSYISQHFQPRPGCRENELPLPV